MHSTENDFVKDFQQLSLCLRWLACSLLPETYAVIKDMSAKKHPKASALFDLSAAIEERLKLQLQLIFQHP